MYRPIQPMLAAIALALPLIAGAEDPTQAPASSNTAPAPTQPLPGYSQRYWALPPWMPAPGYAQTPFGPGTAVPARPQGPPSSNPGEDPLAAPPWAPRGAPALFQIRRQVTPHAYLLRISAGDGNTANIQVTPRGRALSISRDTGTQTTEERRFDDGRGYMRSFSYSSGSMTRRIPLPPDADMTGMTREEADGTILVRIPRQSPRGGADKR